MARNIRDIETTLAFRIDRLAEEITAEFARVVDRFSDVDWDEEEKHGGLRISAWSTANDAAALNWLTRIGAKIADKYENVISFNWKFEGTEFLTVEIQGIDAGQEGA